MGIAIASMIAGGMALGFAGDLIAADATQDAANAERAEAIRQRELALEAAEPSVEELQALNRSLQLAEAGAARNERVLAAVDPALIEAGEQALELLQGKEAQILGPIQEQRAEAREALRQQLASQMGAGFEQSSAGIKALNQFDAQTNQLMRQAQLSAVGQLLGVSTSARQLADPLRASVAFATAAGGFGNIQARKVAAINQTNLTPFAGAPFVGQAAMGESFGNFGKTLFGAGTTLAGYKALANRPKGIGFESGDILDPDLFADPTKRAMS